MIKTIVKIGMPVDEEFCIKNTASSLKADAAKNGSVSLPAFMEMNWKGNMYAWNCPEGSQNIRNIWKGTVDIYPALNPFGIDSITRGIPAFDLDMNRIFPGRQDGDMNEYVAAEIIKDLEGSDLCIDIHASNIFLTEIPQIRINRLHEEKLLPYALLSNMDFIWIHDANTVLESTLAYSLNSRNVPALVVEMGVGMRITREYGEQLTDGIFRLMNELGIWNGPVSPVRNPVVSRDPENVSFLNAPVSGIFIKTLSHGAHVKEGMEIGCIADPLKGVILCRVTAPADGWLFTVREYPVVDQGSLIARILSGQGRQTGGNDET